MNDAPRDSRPRAHLERASDAAGDVLRLTGAWRLAGLEAIDAELRALQFPAQLTVDASQLAELDSAAALALLSRLPPGVQWRGLAANDTRIIEQVRSRIEGMPDLPPHRRESMLEAIGCRANAIARVGHGHLAFLGAAGAGQCR
jgi:ABC-type transporter Mla MlaB component